MDIKIKPSKLKGTVSAPPSKSMAHRALICAGLADDASIINNISRSDDIEATIDCLKSLGCKIEKAAGENSVTVTGTDFKLLDGVILPCRECGSTLRFLIPVAMTCGKEIIFTGSRRLFERPLSIYEEIAEANQIIFERSADRLRVKGMLKPGTYKIDGSISSQFISGLIFALSLLDGNSEIEIIPPFESRPYVDMTLKSLSDFGVKVYFENDLKLIINGGQKYRSRNITVEGDYSNAAFLDAFNYVGNDIEITGLDPESPQGDKVYKFYFDLLAEGEPALDISDYPDLGPVLMVLAAASFGAAFSGTGRLAIKESDRRAAMKEELKKFGSDVLIFGDEIIVNKAFLNTPVESLESHNDHRIVMALTVLASRLGGTIKNAEAVRKSWPEFFEVLKDLGLEFEVKNLK